MSDDCGSATIVPQHIEGYSTFLSDWGPYYQFPPNHSTYVDINMTLLSASASATWTIMFLWFDADGNSIANTNMPSITGTSGSTFLHYGSFAGTVATQFAFAMVADISMIGLTWSVDMSGTVVFLGCDEPTGGGVGTRSNMVTILG